MKHGKPGRPPLADAKRQYLGMKASTELHAAIEMAALKNETSMSEEMRYRLERTFREDLILQRLDRLEAAIKALGALLMRQAA